MAINDSGAGGATRPWWRGIWFWTLAGLVVLLVAVLLI